MSGMSSFAQGFMDRQDENRRRRRELADAFNQFRASNPHASLREMQDYIDASAGGSNYLRGGMPSQQVLEQIARDNEDNRARELSRQQLSDQMDRLNMTSRLQALAEDYLGNYEGDDLDRAYEEWADSTGIERTSLAEYGANGFFNMNTLERVRADQLEANLPAAISMIEASGAQNISPQMIANRFDIPLDVARPLVIRAQEEHDRRAAERASTNAARERQDWQAANDAVAAAQERARNEAQYRAYLIRGDQAGAAQFLNNYVERAVHPEYVNIVFGEVSDANARWGTYLEGELTGMQEVRRADWEETQSSARTTARAQMPQLRQQSHATAQELNGGADERSAQVAAQLAQRYQWNAATQNAFTQAMATNRDAQEAAAEGRTLEVVQAISNDPVFNAVARPFSEVEDRTMRAILGPRAPETQTFEDWTSTQEDDLSGTQEDLRASLVAARKVAVNDPDGARTMYQRELERLQEWRDQTMAELELADTDRDWVEVGSNYNGEYVQSLAGRVDDTFRQLVDQVHAAAAELPQPQPTGRRAMPTSVEDFVADRAGRELDTDRVRAANRRIRGALDVARRRAREWNASQRGPVDPQRVIAVNEYLRELDRSRPELQRYIENLIAEGASEADVDAALARIEENPMAFFNEAAADANNRYATLGASNLQQ